MIIPQVCLKLGTAVKIQTVLELENAESVTITIEGPYGEIKVDRDTMSQVAPSVYQYIWQSDENKDEAGNYVVTVRAKYGLYVSVDQTKFVLEDIK